MKYLVEPHGELFDSFFPTHVVVRFRKVRRKSNFAQVGIEYARGQLYVIYKTVQFISKPPHSWTLSAAAWPSLRLCYRPAVFFYHLLISFPIPQRKIRRAL